MQTRRPDGIRRSIEWGSPMQNKEANNEVDKKAHLKWSGLKNKKS